MYDPTPSKDAPDHFLLDENGINNIICMQPFACFPNYVTGKGIIKELKRIHPETNIVAINYDHRASEVNQLNRIKLMISSAFKNLKWLNYENSKSTIKYDSVLNKYFLNHITSNKLKDPLNQHNNNQ